jgi:hypothetical protein
MMPTMPGWLRSFWRNPVARVAGLVAGMGVLALCLYGGYVMLRGAATAGASPHVGGQLSEFTAAYGQPANPAAGEALGADPAEGVRYYADAAHTITVDARARDGVVMHVSVKGPASWTEGRTSQFCAHFVPNQANAYRSTGRYTYYHSIAGDVVLNNAGHGACQVSLASTYPPA